MLTCYHITVPYSVVRSLTVLQCGGAVPYSVVPYSVTVLMCYHITVPYSVVRSLTVLQCYSDAVPYSVV